MNFFLQTICLILIFLLELPHEFVWAQNRIIGGDETTIDKFPYMLRLQIGRNVGRVRGVCGAAIIGKEWVLTAAHCFDNPETDFDNIRVIAGTTDIKNVADTVQYHKVIQVIRHELYQGIRAETNSRADIAVLKISPPFNFNNVIQPVMLPERGHHFETDFATITGWGDTEPGGPSSSILKYVTLPKVNTEICRREYLERRINLRRGEICYGFHNETVVLDKCQGDSGGPLVNLDKIDIGIVSWGVSCGTRGLPGIYTDVSLFRDWIKNKTGI